MSVALLQADERGHEGSQVVVRLGVVSALHPELNEGQLRIDELELGGLLPDGIEAVLGNKDDHDEDWNPIRGLTGFSLSRFLSLSLSQASSLSLSLPLSL